MPSPSPIQAAVIGGGPAGLIAAETLAAAGLAVPGHDRMPSVGGQFLMAGRGGAPPPQGGGAERFTGRYGPAAARLAPAIAGFPPARLRQWSEGLGQPTFEGSSGRVFPEGFKTSPLL